MMNARKLSRLGILLITIISMLPVMMGYANVPTILTMEIEARGEAVYLVMEVSHSSPTATHFVSTAEVEVGDETVIHLDLVPQTSGTFNIEVELESMAETIRARVDCTTHGWSSWRTITTEEDGGRKGIPGFPIAAVATGLMSASFLLRRARER